MDGKKALIVSWYPVSNSDALPVAFQIDRPDADVVMEDNVVEGIVGEMNPKSAIIIKRKEGGK